MGRTLFVGDVHLAPGAPGRNARFLQFLEEDCDALYLAGDVFDYWIGPKHMKGDDYRDELAALRRKASRCPVFFVGGNRDYLVDEGFARATGVRVLGDRAVLRMDGRSVYLTHGDALYNRNPKYRAYRAIMRSRPVADLWRAVPAAVGKTLARGFRRVSPKTTRPAAWTPEDLIAGARPLFDRGTDVLICGHVHQPQHLSLEWKGRRRDIFILGDWSGGTRDYVIHDGRGFRFTRWD